MSFFSASESLNSLPNDENITVYVEHDKFVDTSTISRRDNVFNKKLFDKHKKPSGLRDSMKITYDKDKYNLYTYLEQMVLGFTTQNNFGENLRSIINLPISTFKKLGGNVISIYIPEKVLSFIVNVPLQSGNPALNNFFSGVIMKDLNDMALEEEPRNNIPLNVVINTSGGQLSTLTWKDNLSVVRSRWSTDIKSFCDLLREDYVVNYTNGVAYECSDADLKEHHNDN